MRRIPLSLFLSLPLVASFAGTATALPRRANPNEPRSKQAQKGAVSAPAGKSGTTPASAATPAERPAPKPAAPPPAPAQLSLQVQRATLDNGLRVVLNVDHTSPTIAVAVTYDVGARNEDRG